MSTNVPQTSIHFCPTTPSSEHFPLLSKKKYIKVNEAVKNEFLNCIIHHNLSIKQASEKLNINYSSAKAILSSHRRIVHAPKQPQSSLKVSSYRILEIDSEEIGCASIDQIICTIGGKSHKSSQLLKSKLIHKTPIIVLKYPMKGLEDAENTSNSHN